MLPRLHTSEPVCKHPPRVQGAGTPPIRGGGDGYRDWQRFRTYSHPEFRFYDDLWGVTLPSP